MKKLYELKEKLCDTLEDYGDKEITTGTLDVIDKLAHSIKNIDKVIEGYEGGYSNGYSRYYEPHGHSNKRDSMGRYSSRDEYSRRNMPID